MTSEATIRGLIQTWARAVQARDLEGVLRSHSDDIIMFDVPPPVTVKGLAPYRDTWPSFFEWQQRIDGVFEIVDLDVTAGEDVAYATAVLRCASKEALQKDDTPRLRLTLGLRKDSGRWLIAHEHHSFPAETNQ